MSDLLEGKTISGEGCAPAEKKDGAEGAEDLPEGYSRKSPDELKAITT